MAVSTTSSTAPRAGEPRRLPSRDEEVRVLCDGALGARPDDGPMRVLEAGCGQKWPLSLGDVPLHITGVDTDGDALKIRRAKHHDLDEEILGDLRTVELPADSYDLAYCAFVLEHVEGAERVLDRLIAAVRPGGRLIIRVPDGESVYGLLVRYSPHSVHVLYKKYIQRKPDAGKPGHPPYPVVYDDVISIRGMRSWAARHNLEIADSYTTNFFVKMFGPLRGVVAGSIALIGKLSRGKLSPTHNNVGFVFVKPALEQGSSAAAS